MPLGGGGYLVLTHPWPAIARTIWGDPDRYVETYFGKYGPEIYVAGDGAKRDEEGYFWLLGRIDDVMNVAGHRLSTFEIESRARRRRPKVAEAAVVSQPHDLKGEAIVAFVTLKSDYEGDDAMAEELRDHVAQMIGKIARPHGIIFTTDLPKTRSGKIMRRLLRDVARGDRSATSPRSRTPRSSSRSTTWWCRAPETSSDRSDVAREEVQDQLHVPHLLRDGVRVVPFGVEVRPRPVIPRARSASTHGRSPPGGTADRSRRR